MNDFFACPNCYAEVPWDATVCPECGADEETGWSQAADYAHLLPDEDEELEDEQARPLFRLPEGVDWSRVRTAVLAGFMVSVFLAASIPFPWGLYLVPLFWLVLGLVAIARQQTVEWTPGRERQLYDDLLRKARGDEELVERWLDYEERRNPGASTAELLEGAIYRWERDNR